MLERVEYVFGGELTVFIRISLVSAILLTPAVVAQNLIPNGTFDEGLTGWSANASPGAGVEWTSAGRYGGGLLIDGSGVVTVGGGRAWTSECLRLEPGLHTLQGDVFLDGVAPFGFCGIYRRRYLTSDCTGSPVVTDAISTTNGEWATLETLFTVEDPEGDSFDVILHTSILGGSGERHCVFDNVSLVGPTPPTLEIPTVDSLGLGALFLALALAGSVLARRKPERRVLS